jgi:hypothetical protein
VIASRRTASRLAALAGAPLTLALLIPLGSGRPELELARALLLLVCLGQMGGALTTLLEAAEGNAERAVAALLFAISAGGALAVALGAAGWLRAPLFLGAVAFGALVLSPLAGRRLDDRPESRPAPPPRSERIAIALAVALAAGTLAHDLRAARYQPAGAELYDDVSYHLPAAVLWQQSGDLRMLRFDYGDRSTSFYPILGELADWMLLAGFEGSDFLARWSQLPAAVGILFGVWALARRLGASPWGALVALLLSLTAPRIFPELALSAGNDLWAAFFVLAALLAARHAGAAEGTGRMVPLVVALGALVGTKYSTLLWLPWLLGAVALAGAIQRPRAAGSIGARRLALAAALLLLTPAAYGYVRNWVTTGNPVFPQPLSIAGRDLLPGWERTALASRLERERRDVWDLGAFSRAPELIGPIWGPALVPVALLLPLAVGFTERRRLGESAARFRLAAALGPLWLVGVYAVALHDHRDVRYALAALPLAAAGAAGLGAHLPALGRWLAGSALAAVALHALFAPREGTPGVALAVAAVAAGIAWLAGARRLPGPPIAALACLLLALDAGRTLARYAERRSATEPAARALERLTGGRPATIAYVGGNRPYYLYGGRLQNRVEIVPSRGDVAVRHYRWGQPIEPDPFAGGRPAPWLRNLERLGVEYVVVDSRGEETRPARWLRRRASPLVRVDGGVGWRIHAWRSKGAAAPAPAGASD